MKATSEDKIPTLSKKLCNQMLTDLENARRPVLEAIKCSLDNSKYSPSVGYLTPGSKTVRTELNVSSVQKMSRAILPSRTAKKVPAGSTYVCPFAAGKPSSVLR